MNTDSVKTITEKSTIVRLLTEQCLLQEAIELFVNGEPPLFCSRLLNEFPDDIEVDGNSGASGHYSLHRYMTERHSFLLEPPCSDASGNIPLNKGCQFVVKFYTGRYAYEAVIPFEQMVTLNGGAQAVQAGLPETLKVTHSRNQLRVTALADSRIIMKIVSPEVAGFRPHLRDMSTGGLSFCVPQQFSDTLSDAGEVQLELGFADDDNLVIHGSVCHCTPIRTMECCAEKVTCDTQFGQQKFICGIDIDTTRINHARWFQINEILYFIQRERLIKERNETARLRGALAAGVAEEISNLRRNDIQLLENDRTASLAGLVSGVSHEINDPVSNVKSLIAYVEKSVGKVVDIAGYWDDKPVPEPLINDFREFLSQINFDYLISTLDEKFNDINDWLEKIVATVNSLESFTVADKKSVSGININESIENSIKVLSTGENVEFVCELQQVPVVECFANDINQSILQIIQNAVEAVEDNGIIRITSSHDEKEDQVTVKIIDNGNGMPPDVLQKVFNPFFTTKPEGEGTGMGMSIVDKIIKRHMGRIDIASKEDLGTTVTITLPTHCKA